MAAFKLRQNDTDSYLDGLLGQERLSEKKLIQLKWNYSTAFMSTKVSNFNSVKTGSGALF